MLYHSFVLQIRCKDTKVNKAQKGSFNICKFAPANLMHERTEGCKPRLDPLLIVRCWLLA